jgi:lipid-A-disaccharide synthase-like uncharacterized protein
MSGPTTWIAVGFLGQAFFTARFLVQWLASERNRKSVVPSAFWWLSLFGGVALLSYAISRRDVVIITGQAMGLFVYVRNLMLLRVAQRQVSQIGARLNHNMRDRLVELGDTQMKTTVAPG